MDWRGIEWAVPIYEFTALMLPVYAFVRFSRRVKHGILNKPSALLRFATLALSPLLAYCLFFAALVAIETVSNVSVITEGLARSFLLLVGLGLAFWLVALFLFGIGLLFIRSRPEGDRNTEA
jgi:hypothetical protein